MADRCPGAAKPLDLALVEPDAVRQPDAIAEPADLFEVIQRPAAEAVAAPGFFVLGLGKMGVQADVMARGEFGAGPHQAVGDRKG